MSIRVPFRTSKQPDVEFYDALIHALELAKAEVMRTHEEETA
jgi:hypothetical protein